MNSESQNIEFKESWRDEYQKWICGFANTQGGILYVSVKDNGMVCGVPVPYLKAKNLDNVTFDLFHKYAKRSGRMKEANLMDDNHGLLEKVRLYEGSYLKRAVALLFHPDQEKYGYLTIFKFEYPERATTQSDPEIDPETDPKK